MPSIQLVVNTSLRNHQAGETDSGRNGTSRIDLMSYVADVAGAGVTGVPAPARKAEIGRDRADFHHIHLSQGACVR